jgi:adenylosuccinate synthase
MEALEVLRRLELADTELYLNQALGSGKKILAEGAQGSMLDIDFGSYPYVTSSNTSCGAVCSGLGIPPRFIGEVYGVFKAYCTRVGNGPFPTELLDETGEMLRAEGAEFGSTTGRPRRCGWLDLPALRYAIMLNGVTTLIMTKADVLGVFDKIYFCDHYKIHQEQFHYPPYEISGDGLAAHYCEADGWKCGLDQFIPSGKLPDPFEDYIHIIEKHTGTRIGMVSVGPGRSQIIHRGLSNK